MIEDDWIRIIAKLASEYERTHRALSLDLQDARETIERLESESRTTYDGIKMQ